MPMPKKVELKYDPKGPYQTYKPSPNFLLQRKWDHDKYHKHRSKVEAASHALDTSAPRTHFHLKVNLKKIEGESRLKARRARENDHHKDHMESIRKKGSTVDHIKKDHVLKSLTKDQRLREILEMATDNMALFKRLNARDANYKVDDFKEEFDETREFMTNCAFYHHEWHQEQEPYLDRKRKQFESDKRIKEQIRPASSHRSGSESKQPSLSSAVNEDE